MTRQVLAVVLSVLTFGGIARGQANGAHPTFDAASVKACEPLSRCTFGLKGGPGSTDPGRIQFGRTTMLDLLTAAYGVELDQISGPPWIRDFMGPNIYEVIAMMPPGTTKEQYRLMLQSLLAERFHLAVHHETKDFPGYELVVAPGGIKMTPAPTTPEEAIPVEQMKPMEVDKNGFPARRPGSPGSTIIGGGMMRSTNRLDMTEFARYLGPMINHSTGVDNMNSMRPRVVDKTGLTGKFDFQLEFSGLMVLPAAAANLPIFAGRGRGDGSATASDPVGSGGPTIFTALEKQLGLRLVKTKSVPLDVVVIDRVDKAPTAN